MQTDEMLHDTGKPIEILLVEDNPGDVRLTQEAFRENRVRNHLHVTRDGAEALAFLHKEGTYAGVPRPDLILLDLNLPKKDGREVLSEIKADGGLRCIPVIVLTGSAAEEDVLGAYGLNANCYVWKPLGFDRFLEVIRRIESFWLTIVQLPPE